MGDGALLTGRVACIGPSTGPLCAGDPQGPIPHLERHKAAELGAQGRLGLLGLPTAEAGPKELQGSFVLEQTLEHSSVAGRTWVLDHERVPCTGQAPAPL